MDDAGFGDPRRKPPRRRPHHLIALYGGRRRAADGHVPALAMATERPGVFAEPSRSAVYFMVPPTRTEWDDRSRRPGGPVIIASCWSGAGD